MNQRLRFSPFAMLVALQFSCRNENYYVMVTVIVSIHVAFYANGTRGFSEMYRELYGLSYPGIMWPLPSETRVRSQGTRMAFSNIDGESVEEMKSN